MTFDRTDPLSVLLAARTAFGTKTEAAYVAELTDRMLALGAVDWLEVGAGDGRHLAYQLGRLSLGRRIQAVALEPSSFARPILSDAITWLQRRVEDYNPDREFNWVNMRHCAYYLADPISQIERLSTYLHHTGVLALTHWSLDCILYRLHRAIYGPGPDISAAAIEDLVAVLATNAQLDVSKVEYYDTELLIDRPLSDPRTASALFELVGRGRNSCALTYKDQAKILTEAMLSMPNAELRRNGVVLVTRRRD